MICYFHPRAASAVAVNSRKSTTLIGVTPPVNINLHFFISSEGHQKIGDKDKSPPLKYLNKLLEATGCSTQP
jgi:hypothetical protein